MKVDKMNKKYENVKAEVNIWIDLNKSCRSSFDFDSCLLQYLFPC